MSALAVEATGVSLAYCECGCGAATNERQIEAWQLRGEGVRNVEIAEMWGLNPDSVKSILHRKPSRFIKGHVVFARMGPTRREWMCERCGSKGWSTNNPPPKFCQRRACLATAVPVWAGISKSVEANVERRRERLTTFFQMRSLRADRRERRKRWATPAEKAKQAARRFTFRAMSQQEAERWIARQSDEVREFVELQAKDPRNLYELHLDAPIGDRSAATLNDLLPHGGSFHRMDVRWVDPTPEPVIERWADEGAVPFDDPRFFMWAKRAAILPHDYIEQCAMERMVLVVESGEARFLVNRRDDGFALLPWHDAPSVAREQAAIVRGSPNGYGGSGKRTQSMKASNKGRDHGKHHEPLADQTMKSLRSVAS